MDIELKADKKDTIIEYWKKQTLKNECHTKNQLTNRLN